MKKYIRTNDGIYKTRQCYPEETLFENVTYVYRHEFVKNKDIIAEADTIEELCDEFVVIYSESKKFTKPFTSAYCDIKDVLKEHDLSECKIYGAIWTDKGLIYVAKMNESGVLELL